MNKLLEGKVALVTGGSRGIGRAISQKYVEEGAKVVINYFSKADKMQDEHYKHKRSSGGIEVVLESIRAQGGDAVAFDLDISDTLAHERLVDYCIAQYGRIDILVNNAGICNFVPFEDLTIEEWNRAFGVNLTGPSFLAQKVIRKMKEQPLNRFNLRGSIINIGSISGQNTGGNLQHHYCATKAGLHALTATLSQNYGPAGIRVNAIAPGVIVTDSNRYIFEADAEGAKRMLEAIPLKRSGTPEEVAGVALFLASDELSSYVTGSIIDVNGGLRVVVAGDELEN